MAYLMSRRAPGRISAGVLGAAVALAVLQGAGSVQAATVTVAAINYEFKPASRTIAAGDTVRWTFSGEPHSATSDDGLFDSGLADPGGSFQFTFVTAGTYRYHCQVHPEQMVGTIVVKAAVTPTPTVRATQRPTARPTAQPTVRPTPSRSAYPTAPPPATSSPSPPPATSSPSSPSSPSTLPVPSESAGASQALLESAVPASPSPGAAAPTSATDAAPIVALLVVLGALVGAGLVAARRRRVT